MIEYYGYSYCRLYGKEVGFKEFHLTKFKGFEHICWPAGYPQHYLDFHNVYPSKYFFNFVMNFSIPNEISPDKLLIES